MVSITKALKIFTLWVFVGFTVFMIFLLLKKPEKFAISAENLNDDAVKLTFHIDKNDTLFLVSLNTLYNPSWFSWRCSEVENNQCPKALQAYAAQSNIQFTPPNTMIVPKYLLDSGVTNVLAWSFKKSTFFSSTAFCFADHHFYSIADAKRNYLKLKEICHHP